VELSFYRGLMTSARLIEEILGIVEDLITYEQTTNRSSDILKDPIVGIILGHSRGFYSESDHWIDRGSNDWNIIQTGQVLSILTGFYWA
jgi:hypothetical protein